MHISTMSSVHYHDVSNLHAASPSTLLVLNLPTAFHRYMTERNNNALYTVAGVLHKDTASENAKLKRRPRLSNADVHDTKLQ
jgi:hypothetical protein